MPSFKCWTLNRSACDPETFMLVSSYSSVSASLEARSRASSPGGAKVKEDSSSGSAAVDIASSSDDQLVEVGLTNLPAKASCAIVSKSSKPRQIIRCDPAIVKPLLFASRNAKLSREARRDLAS